ncbi:TIR domain-containing protein [candidate division WOR-3 bacterium]|uniref:TIR domain-containing protein n=1 Tax=candidate division WOR-3 bacterium TaxID=2052148 RepID=A0A9D5K9Y3_UNCW3|nr:TIR domain-containing protein [candidate division WOR-3 bacterium]MBD3365193.1 TIR domain-containing protein [candidate division WOR-3 bacterium]
MADDLRICRIDPWLDEWEIPAGAPFQRTIFGDGIPNCDSFFIYLSEASIKSEWVIRELDAAFIQQSRDKSSKIITFVDADETRKKLPPDIAALQSPIINNQQYYVGFIRFVSRIYENQITKIKSERNLDAENQRLILEKKVAELEKELIKLERGDPLGLEEIYLGLGKHDYIIKGQSRMTNAIEIFQLIYPLLVVKTYVFQVAEKNLDFYGSYDSTQKIYEQIQTLFGISFEELLSPFALRELIKRDDEEGYISDRSYMYLTNEGKNFALFLERKEDEAADQENELFSST